MNLFQPNASLISGDIINGTILAKCLIIIMRDFFFFNNDVIIPLGRMGTCRNASKLMSKIYPLICML